MRLILRRAPFDAVVALAGAVLLIGACTAAGGSLAPATAITSLAPAVPSATATATPAATETPASGGGRGDYDYGDDSSASGSASPASPVPGGRAHQVNQATGQLGVYLTGDNSLTLYTFKPDTANTSTCTGSCATSWPPFTAAPDDELEAGDGVDGALTTFARADGTMQVAYDGAPLYYFAKDTQPGDTNGQGLGDAWFVAKP